MTYYARRVLRNYYYEHRPRASWRVWEFPKCSDNIISARLVIFNIQR